MGIKRTCLRFALKRVKVKRVGRASGYITALRCVDYRKGKGKPPCHKFKRDGGRSKGLINKVTCVRGRGSRRRRQR